jgi:Xaa-Pro dipeptidase
LDIFHLFNLELPLQPIVFYNECRTNSWSSFMSINRYDRLMNAVQAAGLDALALNPGPSLVYLTGLPFHLMERPTVLLLRPDTQPVLVLPELELAKLAASPIPLRGIPYGDNPETWQNAFSQAAELLGLEDKVIGVEPERLRFLELRFLEAAAPTSRFVTAQAVLASMRICKDNQEIEAQRAAVHIAQNALLDILPKIHSGMSEKQVANLLVLSLLRHGSDPEIPFQPIVSSGPNSANPHATPSDRRLQKGDLLVIDWGAARDGYCSDLTRTFAVEDVDTEYLLIHQLVMQANAAGRAAGKPGVRAGDVDKAARAVINLGGYGGYFTHRTGHGLGMEGHEPPYIFGENDLILAPGMTYTVEPGIYLPGRGGVRIEDNIVITANGSECLSDLPRELLRVG